ncbi:MAG: histidinol-phosphate transaminase [Gammaproteobacteria bacterium]|nr:histidinol-phosphate transaminase [Gammaproteobacteria bacterium]
MRFINEGARQLKPYKPGLSAERARAHYQAESFIKLASNENAYGPAPRVQEILRQPWAVERYPDPDQSGLVEELARYYDVAPECIVVGAGSSELLDRIARLVLCPGKKAIYSQYAFSLYRQYILNCGAEPVEVPAHPPRHFSAYGHDLRAMALAADDNTSLIYIASPNNPTGTYNATSEIENLMDNISSDTIVVIDQAYAEYAPALVDNYPDLIGWHQRYPNLMITRTFSKIHALAGLRVGYACAGADVAQWLRRIRAPFNVSQLAQEAAVLALRETAYVHDCAAKNAEEMYRILAATDQIGLRSVPTAANFAAFDLRTPAAPVYEALMRDGVIARTLDEYGLDHHLRLTFGRPNENDQALQSLQRCFDHD